MKPWRSYYAFSRLKSCIEELVEEVDSCIESDLAGSAGAEPDRSADLSTCADRLASIGGVLRAMDYNEFALYVDEIHALYSLSVSLDPVNDIDVLNDIRELLYLVIIDFPALLEGVLSGQIVDWHEYSGMFNRMRKARHRGLIFSSDTLMTRQETDFSAIFTRNGERYTQILQRHIHHYREARKLLIKAHDMERGLDAMHRVFSGLAVVCRDYRLSTLWGLCAALSQALPESARSHENEAVRLLCSFSSILDAVCTRGTRAHDQNIPEDILEKVLDAFTLPLIDTGPVLAVRQWFNLDLRMTRRQRQKYRALVVGYSGKEALIKAMGLLNEQISALLNTINEITSTDEADPGLTEDHESSVRQIRCTLQVLGMTRQVTALDEALHHLPEGGGTDHETRMASLARALYSSELALKARQEELERAVFASRTGQEDSLTLTGARMAIVIEVLRNLERVVISINHYVDDGMEADKLREAIPLLEESRTALTTVSEKRASAWCLAAQEYAQGVVNCSEQMSLDERFHAFAHLVINTILYLEQLGIGQFGDMAEIQDENDRLAAFVVTPRESVPEAAQSTANGGDPVVVPFQIPANEGADDGNRTVPAVENTEREVDDDLREVFIAEAGEILPVLQENLRRLASTPDDSEALTELRRGFHTLKGSGRMVEALAIAELAWGVEQILNRHIAMGAPLPERLLSILSECQDALQDMVESFRQKQPSAAESAMPQALIEKLHSLDTDGELSEETGSAVADDSEILAEDATDDVQLSDAGDILEYGHDPLFIREAERQVDTIRSLLERSDSTDISIGDFQIAVHTLHGSCRVAGETGFAALVGRLESTLQDNPHSSAHTGLIQLLEAFCSITERFLLDLAKSKDGQDPALDGDVQVFLHDLAALGTSRVQRSESDHSLLLEGFLRETRPVHASLTSVMHSFSDTGVMSAESAARLRQLATQIEGAAEVAGQNALAGLCHGLARLGDSLSKGECHPGDELVSAADACLREVDAIMAGLESETPSTSEKDSRDEVKRLNMALEKAVAEQHDRVRQDAEKADEDDLIRVFDDEASELLQELDTALADWRQSPDDAGIMDDIARHLHTLKGSAALVGQSEMSHAAHDFETLLLEIRHTDKHPDAAFYSRSEALLESLQRHFAVFRGQDVQKHEITPPSDASEKVVSIEDARQQTQSVVSSIPIDEYVRVSGNLLQRLLNDADEIDVSRNRLELALTESRGMMTDMQETLGRLNAYLQRFEQQARPTLSSSIRKDDPSPADDFDALEMDRYTELQQIWLSLREDYDDLNEIRSNILNRMRFMESILADQQRVTHKLQEGLISSQMVPFSSIVPRLRRLVRQVAQELDKSVSVRFSNPEGKIDRSMLQTVIGPVEHMIRNAIDHGVETQQERQSLGKSPQSELLVKLFRQGANIILDITDDGRGIDPDRVRLKAIEDGLVSSQDVLSEQELCQLILRAGFSTSDGVSRISGRGVGLDVVQEEIHQIGGELEIFSRKGTGTTFRIRLPLSSSLNRALLFRLQGQDYVMLLNTIDGILMEKSATLRKAYNDQENAQFEYAGECYELAYLGALLDTRTEAGEAAVPDDTAPLLLISGQNRRIALHVDSIVGTRELIVRSLGPQFSTVSPVSGGVILGDGRVVIVLDPITLVDNAVPDHLAEADRMFDRMKEEALDDSGTRTVLVVDDSITVRKVTSAILQRNGMKVLLARDGMEAVEILQSTLPDVMLLDIEMPKMDGFEVASYIRRQDSAMKDIPIIMITSRIGDKHRTRAEAIGVNQYMCKPFQEENLLQAIAGYQS